MTDTHRPDLVITISVPFLWNSVQSSLCSSVTLGSSFTLSSSGGGGLNPGPGPNGKPGKRGKRPGYPEMWRLWTTVNTLPSQSMLDGRHPPDGVLKLFVGPRPGKWPGEKEPGWNGGGWWGYPDTPDTPDKPMSGLGSSGGGGKLVMVSQVGEGLMSSWHVTMSRIVTRRLSRKSRVVTEQTQFDTDQAPDPICNCWCRIKGWKETGFKSENLK